jgi:hypothetical protein
VSRRRYDSCDMWKRMSLQQLMRLNDESQCPAVQVMDRLQHYCCRCNLLGI